MKCRQFIRFAGVWGGGERDFSADFASETWGAAGVVNGRFA